MDNIKSGVPSYDRFLIIDRLKQYSLPISDNRVKFIWWVENQESHVFTMEDYVAEFGDNNRYKHLNEYLESGYLTRVVFNYVTYYVSSYVSSHKASPFICSCCGQINMSKLLNKKYNQES